MKIKGFTLIELLIVIAVISILIGIALPRFKGMQDEGNRARAKGELRTLQTAVESFKIHSTNSALPANIGAALTGATPNIIGSTAPTDPFNPGSNYGYNTSGSGVYYVIWSVGPGGSATVTGIDNNGAITGTAGDDIYVTNGNVAAGG
jgi:prepilin-type N-terminal cleavage/methylation domain-containing protein